MRLYLNKLIFLIECTLLENLKHLHISPEYKYLSYSFMYLFCHMGFKITVETMYMSLLFLEN